MTSLCGVFGGPGPLDNIYGIFNKKWWQQAINSYQNWAQL